MDDRKSLSALMSHQPRITSACSGSMSSSSSARARASIAYRSTDPSHLVSQPLKGA